MIPRIANPPNRCRVKGIMAPATPTTLVLDRQGRIAARVSAAVSEATLRALVADALAS